MSDNLYRTPLVPIYSEQSQRFFNGDLPTQEVNIENWSVKTGYLKPGEALSLLGISQSKSLLDLGALDMTDAIDPAMSLSEIAIAYKHNGKNYIHYHALKTESGMEEGAQFSAPQMARVLELNYAGVISIQSKDGSVVNTIGVVAFGHCNLELGDAEIHFEVTSQADPDFTDVQVVGYKLNAQRVNYNRRAA